MSDLREALDRWQETMEALTFTTDGNQEDHWRRLAIVEQAARKYANPDYEAAEKVIDNIRPWGDNRMWAELTVNAALGVTENE